MLQVISFGEALVDMLSTQVTLESGEHHEAFIKFPGGAPANVAAAVSKLNGKACMVGMVGRDTFGEFLIQTLSTLGVDTKHLLLTDQAHTPLAFVSLDATGERSFTFYRAPSADLCFRAADFDESLFKEAGIFHFCSNTLTHEGIQLATLHGIELAKENGFLISFDVNLRHNLWPENTANRDTIDLCIRQSDIIKLSLEELNYLRADIPSEDYIKQTLNTGVQLVIVTDGSQPVQCFSASDSLTLSPPNSKVVDATAAGDSFVGGLLFSLAKDHITRDRLRELAHSLDRLSPHLTFACACGAFTVRKKGAISTLPHYDDVIKLLSEKQ